MDTSTGRSAAEWIAEFIAARGVERVYGLQGGHIQPIWDHLARRGVRIFDVRDEGAAVHMAHCHAVLTGEVGIAFATAGPGVTNCVSAIANAQLERVPVLLIGGCAPVPQDDLGPLQGIDHVSIMRPVTRSARTLRTADNLLRDLDKAWATAMGDGNAPGPVYIEVPTDVLRDPVAPGVVLQEYLAPRPPRRIPPDASEVARAAALIASAHRPLVITGRGAQGAGAELQRLLDATGALYLDTQESRGLVAATHPSFVGAVRARAMKEADLVIAVGRKLDYQMGYGSPAVFPNARWIRIADNAEELRENRRGEVELFAYPSLALVAIAAAMQERAAVDTEWTRALRSEHVRRSSKYAEALASAPAGKDGHMHPNRIFAALREVLRPDAITIADGGDILSFARLGLEAPRTYLDSGTFGCLGVGTPYGVAAGLLRPNQQVVVISGDGAFGINAMEIDTAKRHNSKVVFIIANNAAWNIERLDQEMNYGGRVVGTTLAWSDYAGMARAFGLHAERVTDPARLRGALEEAFAKAPALIDVVVTQDALSSDAGKGLGWVPDYQALTAWDDAEKARRS
ncbi:MAG TPA: thiamine pyrophosphate-binding protein [Casimicrobiaceae bacterium]|nr:thiamine pyrophosphate-binding protein [Casimicrobiaceae bacterium]